MAYLAFLYMMLTVATFSYAFSEGPESTTGPLIITANILVGAGLSLVVLL